MAFQLPPIRAEIIFDKSGFDKGLADAQRKTAATTKKMAADFGNLDKTLKRVGLAIGALFTGRLVRGFLDMSRGIDDLQDSLVGLTGSVEGAEQAVQFLLDTSSRLRIDVDQLAPAFRTLSNAGYDAKASLESVANISTVTGQSQEAVARAIALGSTRILRLIPGLQTLRKESDGYHVTLENGKDALFETEKALGAYVITLGNTGTMVGAAEKGNKDFFGALVPVKTALIELSRTVADTLGPAFVEIGDYLSGAVKRFGEFLKAHKEAISDALINAVKSLATDFEILGNAINNANFSKLGELSTFTKVVSGTIVVGILSKVVQIFGQLPALAAAVSRAFVATAASAGGILLALKAIHAEQKSILATEKIRQTVQAQLAIQAASGKIGKVPASAILTPNVSQLNTALKTSLVLFRQVAAAAGAFLLAGAKLIAIAAIVAAVGAALVGVLKGIGNIVLAIPGMSKAFEGFKSVASSALDFFVNRFVPFILKGLEQIALVAEYIVTLIGSISGSEALSNKAGQLGGKILANDKALKDLLFNRNQAFRNVQSGASSAGVSTEIGASENAEITAAFEAQKKQQEEAAAEAARLAAQQAEDTRKHLEEIAESFQQTFDGIQQSIRGVADEIANVGLDDFSKRLNDINAEYREAKAELEQSDAFRESSAVKKELALQALVELREKNIELLEKERALAGADALRSMAEDVRAIELEKALFDADEFTKELVAAEEEFRKFSVNLSKLGLNPADSQALLNLALQKKNTQIDIAKDRSTTDFSEFMTQFAADLDSAVGEGLSAGLRGAIESGDWKVFFSTLGESLFNTIVDNAGKALVQSFFSVGGGSQPSGSGTGGLFGSLFSAIGGLFGGRHGGTMTAQGFRRFAVGGVVPDLGRPFADSVPALLMPGERVLTRDENKRMQQSTGQGAAPTVVLNIQTNDVESFRQYLVKEQETIVGLVTGNAERNGRARSIGR